MAIGEESFNEFNEVNDHTYDELYDVFKELHDDQMKNGTKGACLKKKVAELTNENESLSAKIACLELENKTLYDKVVLSNKKPSTSHEHLESRIDDLKQENEILKKKNI